MTIDHQMHGSWSICLAVVLCLVGHADLACQNQNVDQWVPSTVQLMSFQFGLKESHNGTAPYAWLAKNSKTNQFFVQRDQNLASLNAILFVINQATLIGGLNMTYINYSSIVEFVPTASLVCQSDTSAIWGPTYPDYRKNDYDQRRRFQNLQTYIHYSVPTETSYIRHILFVKNIGSTSEIAEVRGSYQIDGFGLNISPIENEGRYYTGFPFQENDKGFNGNDAASTTSFVAPSIHAKGSKGRDKSGLISSDPFNHIISPTYRTVLAPGEQLALMYIASFGLNRSEALKNAAEIDAEPAYIFHGNLTYFSRIRALTSVDLTAEQLLLIRNWDGCSAMGDGTSVNVTPSKCTQNQICFSVGVTSIRASAGFTHRVLSSNGAELVALQSSSDFSLPATSEQMTHQLWYKDCLAKETAFDRNGNIIRTPTAPADGQPSTPSRTVSSSSSTQAVVASIVATLVFL